MKKEKKNYKWIILIICIIALLFLITIVVFKDNIMLDEKVHKIISKNLVNDSITPLIKFITFLASTYFLIILAIFLFMIIKNKKIGVTILINLCLSALTNFILKNIIQRPRPIGYNLINEKGFSFPSGHSMVSMAFYGYLIYLINKYIKNKYLKISLIVFLIMLILFVGLSRVYLGVHYTTDVIAGYLLGTIYLIIYVTFIIKKKKE